ncbi:MAG: hypothetical protein DWH91_15895 [Planctomycetota bacterium]|nr:MAG: hypothetical protein DWH91_15895 [Planctomycetota bacterium]
MPHIHATDLVVSNAGSTLLLKLYGFIQDQAAEVRDVTENRLTLRFGRTWLGRILFGDRHAYRMEMSIDLSPLPEANRYHRCSQVHVEIRDAHLIQKPDLFDEAVRQMMWRLRAALMVVDGPQTPSLNA